ncbi:hypothetical protein DM860_006942 [Cuscuta australis]|uniref:Uncharacterized protein n=1 Tax=Cuscuta australis TaxID=267555 RepID=A0A328E6T2_9ASTE|nr:hypothetical protein DM860_006942 [Cuscuta australis]
MSMAMGAGGPLLCICDLLSDIGEEDGSNCHCNIPSPTGGDLNCPGFKESNPGFKASNLTKIFLEKYEDLKEGLAGTDHSWTALTLELCSAMQTANKLVSSTHREVGLLSENVRKLEQKINMRDSNVASAKAIQSCLKGKWNA